MNVEAVQKHALRLYADYLNSLCHGKVWLVLQENEDGSFGLYENFEAGTERVTLRRIPNEDFTNPVKNLVLDIRDGMMDPVLMSLNDNDYEFKCAGLAWLAQAEGGQV